MNGAHDGAPSMAASHQNAVAPGMAATQQHVVAPNVIFNAELPPKQFDERALAEIEATGTLLPPTQLPAAVAAVHASLKASPAAEAALESALIAASQRRAEATAVRDALLTEVTPLRRFLPNTGSDEVLTQLRAEASRRQELELEVRAVRGRVEEIAQRVLRQ